jgi:SAM-dependent methyltransferase
MDHPGEAARLRDKVDAEAWAARYLPAGGAGGRLLELGSGPLHLLETAALRSSARLAVGVDLSEPRLRQRRGAGRSARLGPVVADALALPFPDDSFDVGWTRFLLEYLPDPQRAVDELVRVVRPGGAVLLQDLDGQLVNHHPEDPVLMAVLRRVLAGLHGRLDVFVGRSLFTLARRAGLEDLHVQVEPYHLIAGAPDAGTLELWQRKLAAAMPAVVRAVGEGAADDARRRFLAHLQDPDTLTFSDLFTVTGRAPARGGAARHP